MTTVRYKSDKQGRDFRSSLSQRGITAQDLWQQAVQEMIRGGFSVDDLNTALQKAFAEIEQLKAELAKHAQAESNRIGCTTCANVESCEAETPVCQWHLSGGGEGL